MTEEAVVRGVDDTVSWAIYEKKSGNSQGVQRLEGRCLRSDITNLAKMRCFAVKGRPNFNLFIDNQPFDIQLVRSGAHVEEEAPPEDEETKLLQTHKEQLRVQIASLKTDVEGRIRENARIAEQHERAITAQVALFDREAERLKKERERVDREIKAMNDELEAKREVIKRMAKLEKQTVESLQERTDAVDGDYLQRMQDAREREKEHRKELKEARGKPGEPTFTGEAFKYLRESAPPELVKKGLDAGLGKLLRLAGLEDK